MLPQIGFGTYRLKDCTDIVKYAINSGYKLVDTAELYKNEEHVSKALSKDIFLTTKISPKSITKGLIRKSVEERLKLFGKIDLLLLHKPSDNCDKDWEELVELYEENDKILNIGVSNFKIVDLEKIVSSKVQPFCNQIEVTPFLLRDKLVKYCQEKKIKIVAHSSLTKGEKLDNKTLVEIGKKYKKTPAQILLRWGIQKGFTVLPRSSCPKHVKENMNIFDFEINDKDMCLLDSLNEGYSTHPNLI